MNGEQARLVEGLAALLMERGGRLERRDHGDALEPWVELRLVLPADRGLRVSFVVAPDVFAVSANGADLRMERIDYGDDGPTWIAACLETVERLLDSELRIRFRRTLLGGRVGALRVLRPGRRDVWTGDLLACMGLGTEQVFDDWWMPPA